MRTVLSFAAFAALAACASAPETTPDLAAAETALAAARRSEAPEFAPEPLAQAANKLDRARAALAEKDEERAALLALEARADADYAAAAAEARAANLAVEELRETVDALRAETRR